MRFSYQWLKELVPEIKSSQQLADLLTMYFAETTVLRRQRRTILDVDLLPNRIPDASGHLGLAREIKAILGKKFVFPQIKLRVAREPLDKYLEVKVKTKNCNYYVAWLIKGVKVQSSPKWVQERLKDCGLRPINNIVDATNYVMLLTGQPLHAFDYDKLSEGRMGKKQIIVRQAREGEKITTLDKQTFELTKNNMVIADSEKILALAGIKGGQAAAIDNNTKNIVLESANFVGSNIRATSREIKLRTEASWRFEHSLSPQLADLGMEHLAALILKISGGKLIRGQYQKTLAPKQWFVLDKKKIERFLGWKISDNRIKRILSNLGCEIKERKSYFLVTSPPYRTDVTVKEDLMGEIGRLYGFDKVPSLPPQEELKIPRVNELWELKEKLRDWLKGYGLEEVYNYSLIGEREKEWLTSAWQRKLISLRNPLSNRFVYLRPTFLFNFLSNVATNFKFVPEVRFFEIGKICQKENGAFQETDSFSGVLATKKEKNKDLFYQAKGIIEDIWEKWGLTSDDYSLRPLSQEQYKKFFVHGIEYYHQKQFLGIIGWVREEWLSKYDIQGSVVFWELNLENLLHLIREEKEFSPLPLYPAIVRDISFLVPLGTSIDKITKTIQEASPNYLEDADLFDVYEGSNLPDNKYSVSFHLIFRAPDKTLTSEEVDKEIKRIIKSLKKIGAQLR